MADTTDKEKVEMTDLEKMSQLIKDKAAKEFHNMMTRMHIDDMVDEALREVATYDEGYQE